jgi:hypothetical protein
MHDFPVRTHVYPWSTLLREVGGSCLKRRTPPQNFFDTPTIHMRPKVKKFS